LDTLTTLNFSEKAQKKLEASTGVPRTHFTTIVHEMKHQVDNDKEEMTDDTSVTSSITSSAEIRAVNTENRARKIEGVT